jgi:hypothetical protein
VPILSEKTFDLYSSKYGNYMCCMEFFFLRDRISMGLWSHLPDKNASHFYLLNMLMGEVYNNEPYMDDDKKTINLGKPFPAYSLNMVTRKRILTAIY